MEQDGETAFLRGICSLGSLFLSQSTVFTKVASITLSFLLLSKRRRSMDRDRDRQQAGYIIGKVACGMVLFGILCFSCWHV
jgi:hypothetical protein